MSIHYTHRIDRETAEQLLCGVPAGAGPLADLLAAAAAPARAAELAGEQAALVAFRLARLAPATEPRRQSMIQTALAKLLTVKVAAATIGITALSGVALAAGTGTLPTDLDKAPKAHPSQSQSSEAQANGAGGPKSPKPTPASKGNENDPNGTPSPSMVGLCKAYQAKAGAEQGKSLESPAFTALVTAAGSKDKVAAYCTVALAVTASESPKAHATVKPSDKPDPQASTPVEPGTKPEKPAPSVSPTPRYTAN